jgi:hypothetical protein
MNPKAILSLFRRVQRGRSAHGSRGTWTGLASFAVVKVTAPADFVGRSGCGIGPKGRCGRLIWLNDRSNPYVMDRFAAFRLREVFRRPP